VDDQAKPDAETIPPAHSGCRRRLRASDVVIGAAVGVMLTVAAIVVAMIVSRRHATPALTVERLKAASDRWQRDGLTDYIMDLTVTGRQASRYHVEVRGGKPSLVLRNDRPTAKRSWHYWTVPGLFDVLEHDMDCADDPTRGFGARPGSQAVLRAEFDARGVPRKFERLILGEPQLDMTWEVKSIGSLLTER
jgi:hypothetical protein